VVERRRSEIRAAVVWDALQTVLGHRHQALDSTRPLQVVDVGGGTGGLAVRIAELGHRVTVVDPSPDALASLERRAAEAAVTGLVHGILGDADTLLDVVEPGSADVVVCHGVLEVVDAPARALTAAAAALIPEGHLSVLATQRSAAVFSRAIAGHLGDAQAMLDDPNGRWGSGDPVPRRFTRSQLESLVTGAGFAVSDVHGVRVFSDHISSSLVDSEPGAAALLRNLEQAVASHPDYVPFATQLHLLAIRRG
jgi:S-adenosylmethionine-dependent methyltransferase